MRRPADGFFRLLEGLRLGQLHENHRARNAPDQLNAEIPAVGSIACQWLQRLELPMKVKPSLDRGSHKSMIRQGQWLFRRSRIDSSHRLRIILMRGNLVTQRMSGVWPGALLARRTRTIGMCSLGLMVRLGVPVGGRVKKLRAV